MQQSTFRDTTTVALSIGIAVDTRLIGRRAGEVVVVAFKGYP